jgi:DNA-directed RNA polymerase subunit RPC12/RpoP
MLTVPVWVILGAALVILGFFLMRPDFGDRVWWVAMGVGIASVVVEIISVAFSMRQDVHLDCPHCGGKAISRMKSSTSHLYLTKRRRDEGKLPQGRGKTLREMRSLATFERPAWLCRVKARVKMTAQLQGSRL